MLYDIVNALIDNFFLSIGLRLLFKSLGGWRVCFYKTAFIVKSLVHAVNIWGQSGKNYLYNAVNACFSDENPPVAIYWSQGG